MKTARRCVLFLLVVLLAAGVGAQRAPEKGAIAASDLEDWLSVLASDGFEGRQVYTEGLGLAAGYIAGRLSEWGVEPAGDAGTYFQTVKVLGVRTTSRATVTVDVNGQRRTFKDGEGITFPRNMGGKQVVTGDQVQFAGYGLQIPAAGIDDYAGGDPKGKVVVFLGQGPPTLPPGAYRLVAARGRSALEKGAIAVIGPESVPGGGRGRPGAAPPAIPQPAAGGRGDGRGGRGGAQPETVDFTGVQRFDLPVPPSVTAQDEFLEFLFSGSDVKYAELKQKAAQRQPLPRFALSGVSLTFRVDADYKVVRTRLTRNVVGTVAGSDPDLRDTYVGFGAHFDHVGYRETGSPAGGGANPGGCVGQVRPSPRPGDNINNGADDDGSGTVALMAIARAFALGPKPRRSLLFVWHSGEESGLQGSRYNAEYPVVPNEKIVSVLNLDMVGRNRCDRASEGNTVYLVGSDRISTELHNVSEDANASMAAPMTLDYEMNDPADPESLYTRSDHYSYAAKGIPVIFYTTGLHKDYHWVTDEVSEIEFDKMARIADLVYTTGMRVANLERAPARDNKGPRVGKGSGGKIETAK